jgi:vacuolar protein-sorting-associated protein 4
MGPSPKDPQIQQRFLTPCSPGDADAQEMTWMDITAEELLEPELTLRDFERAVANGRPSVNAADLDMHRKFTEDFGQEG